MLAVAKSRLVILALTLLAFQGCEDKELATRRAEQAAEIRRLNDELSTLRASLSGKPDDDTGTKLAATELALDEARKRVANLRDEAARLKVELRQAEEDLAEFKSRHPLAP